MKDCLGGMGMGWGRSSMDDLSFTVPERCDKCDAKLEYTGCGHYICKECGNEMLDDYGKVRDFLDAHGPTPIPRLMQATGLSREQIETLIKRGSVSFTDR